MQPISAIDLNGEFMIMCMDGLTTCRVHRGAVFGPSHANADDRAPAVVDAPGNRALIRRRQALLAGGLADRIFSRGMQT
jgi:hypothetical protein